MGTVDDELFQYFLSSVIPAPWNVHVRMIGNMSPGLLSKMASSWDAISEEARIGCLLTLIHSPKKPLALELQGEASQLLAVAEYDPTESVRFLAAAIKPVIDFEYIRTDLSEVSDSFKGLIDSLGAFFSNNELDFVPLEAPYLCIEANEALGCSRIKSEGIRLKAEHAIPPLEDRMATYSLEDSVGISGSTISVGSSAGRRQSFPSSSFLRRSSSLNQVQNPTGSSKKMDGSPRKSGFSRPDSASASKSKVLNLAEIQDLNKGMAEDKRKRDDDKAKRAFEKKEARLAKKTKIQEDKVKKSEAREAKEKKELDEKKKQQSDEPAQPIDIDADHSIETTIPIPRVKDVIGDADLLSAEDLKTIDDFLQGRYKIHEEIKEIKLTDRIVKDPSQGGSTRREMIFLLLDFSKCKWKKIRKSTVVSS